MKLLSLKTYKKNSQMKKPKRINNALVYFFFALFYSFVTGHVLLQFQT